jgi:hypothetical protein
MALGAVPHLMILILIPGEPDHQLTLASFQVYSTVVLQVAPLSTLFRFLF